MTDAPLRIWLQEPVGLEYERTWCAEPMSDDDDEYHLHTREALAQSPIVQAMIAEAVRAEREACAKVAHDAGKPYARAFIMRRLAGLGYNISVRSKQRMCVRIAAAIRARGEV